MIEILSRIGAVIAGICAIVVLLCCLYVAQESNATPVIVPVEEPTPAPVLSPAEYDTFAAATLYLQAANKNASPYIRDQAISALYGKRVRWNGFAQDVHTGAKTSDTVAIFMVAEMQGGLRIMATFLPQFRSAALTIRPNAPVQVEGIIVGQTPSGTLEVECNVLVYETGN